MGPKVKDEFFDVGEFYLYGPYMSPEQSRAARGWLGWSQAELAERAGVATTTVHGFESGQRKLTRNNLAALRRAIQAGGVRLVFDGKGAAGILRRDADTELSDDAPA